jgi:hypothetical protein
MYCKYFQFVLMDDKIFNMEVNTLRKTKQSQNLTEMFTVDHMFAISMSCSDTKLKEKYYHSVHGLLKEMII